MLVYEKNNKLNINFDNEISENPDLQISKENGKTEVLIDGQESGGSSGSGGVVTLYFTYDNNSGTFSEAYKDSAMTEGFSSNEEAVAALTAATVVKLRPVVNGDIFGIYVATTIVTALEPVECAFCDENGNVVNIVVAINSNENPDPDPGHY